MQPAPEEPTQRKKRKGWPGRRPGKWWVRKQAALAGRASKQAVDQAPESPQSVHSSLSATTLQWVPSQEAD